jgi:hypothetical protein
MPAHLHVAFNSKLSVRFCAGGKIVLFPQRPDRFSDPPNLLFNGYWEVYFLGGKAAEM